MCNDDCVLRLLKASLLLFNLLLAGMGSGGLALGAGLHFAKNDTLNLVFQASGAAGSTKSHVRAAANIAGLVSVASAVFCAAGTVGLMIGGLGCIGACCEKIGLLRVYAFVLCAILLLNIGLVAALFLLVFKQSSTDLIQNELFELQTKYYLPVVSAESSGSQNRSPTKLSTTHIINSIQIWFQCCGIKRTGDIATSSSWNASDKTWQGRKLVRPPTCCKLVNSRAKNVVLQPKFDQNARLNQFLMEPDCPFLADSPGAHNKTCPEAIVDYISSYTVVCLVLSGMLIGGQVAGICLACYLVNLLDDEYEEYDDW